MYYNLFLDDERKPSEVKWLELPPVQWFIVKNYREFVDIIQRNGVPARISFDHDLADEHYASVIENEAPSYGNYEEKTGYDCCKWLLKYCVKNKFNLPEIFIHTMNPVGRANIKSLLDAYRRVCDNNLVVRSE